MIKNHGKGIYCWRCKDVNRTAFYKGITSRCITCCNASYEEDQALARAGKARHVGLKAEWNSPRGSIRWKILRMKRIEIANGKCERCGEPQEQFQIHHLTYERFGGELISDVQALCRRCHGIADRERRREIGIWIERAHRRGEMFERGS